MNRRHIRYSSPANPLLLKRILHRRAFVLGALQIGVSGVLMSRLLQLQMIKSDKYSTIAEENRVNLQLIVPERGLILDRFGLRLAENKQNFQLIVEKKAIKEQKDLLDKLTNLMDDKQINFNDVLQRQIKRNPHESDILLKENLSWEEVSRIEFNAPHLQGVRVANGMLRYYPLGAMASHLLGYVGTPSPEEAKGNRLLKMPEIKIGKSGLERKLEMELRGIAGMRHMEVNSKGQYLQELERLDAKAGANIKSTISLELQQYCAERLGEESGSIVVLDVRSGDVLALCTMPAFDPNRFSKGITSDYWAELMADKKTPLMNKAITGQYPPGSTFKMLVGLAALQEGIITPDTRFYCPGHYFLGSHRFNCWKPGGHGSMNYRGAIAESCDTFFYNTGRKVGIEKIAKICHEFGLGEVYNLGLIGEKAGLVPTPEWKRKSYNQLWQAGDTVNVSIGQGYVLATPFQLAIMAARLATSMKVMPRLVVSDEMPSFKQSFVDPKWIELARAGMVDVTSAWNGTARGAQIKEVGYEMAGKTGTAQVRRIKVRGQDQNRLPWEARHHALFVAYAPVAEPRYAASVVIEHGGGGAGVAAPIARDIMLKTQQIMETPVDKKLD
jgi:penicillin-binding protein 2